MCKKKTNLYLLAIILINIIFTGYTIKNLQQIKKSIKVKHICNNRPCCKAMLHITHPNIDEHIKKIITDYKKGFLKTNKIIKLYNRNYKVLVIKINKNKTTVILDNIKKDERIHYTCYKNKKPIIKIVSKSNLKIKTIKLLMSCFGPIKFVKSFIF